MRRLSSNGLADMILSFCQEQISGWARLSGDYNPIHFDEDRARGAGLSDIVVHGMLPLLHIKQKISNSIALSGATEWLTVKTVFRQPVLRHMQHVLDIESRGSRSRFSLCATQDGVEVMSGRIFAVNQSVNSTEMVDSFTVDTELYRQKKAIFLEIYPGFEKAWLLVDAITFSQFLENEIPFSLVKNQLELRGVANQAELMKSALTVQTSHTLTIEPSFYAQKTAEMVDPNEIRCELLPPVTVAGGKDSLSGLCQFNVFMDDAFVMQSEVGIFVRFAN